MTKPHRDVAGTDGVAHQDVVEDLAIAARIRERDTRDDGARRTLGEFARELGIDLEAL